MGWEYLHWVDLRLTKLMEVSIFQINLTKIHFLQKSTFLESNKRSKNVQKGPTASKQIFFANQGVGNLKIGKSEGGESKNGQIKMLGPI